MYLFIYFEVSFVLDFKTSLNNSLISSAALSRHYDTQASPTPLTWYAHQLPDWLSRLGAVCVLVVEIAVPLLMFFIPVRGLRINAFSILVGQACYMLHVLYDVS